MQANGVAEELCGKLYISRNTTLAVDLTHTVSPSCRASREAVPNRLTECYSQITSARFLYSCRNFCRL